MDHSTE